MRLVLTSPRWARRALFFGACASATACATAVPVGLPRAPNGTTVAGSTASGTSTMPPEVRWPVRTLSHVDLWLHAFAMIGTDSATVPLYRRGYRDSLVVVKNQRTLLTALDANR